MPGSFSSDIDAPGMLLMAVPKKGRLYEKCKDILKGIGIDYTRKARTDVAYCTTLPIKLVFLPAKDIATFVGEGNVDVGITGEDMVAETNSTVDIITPLGFGKCKLCVQAPVKNAIKDPSVLLGKRIATSFPNLTRKFFAGIREKATGEGASTESSDAVTIRYVTGSVEAACTLGLADAVVDLVETGTTMRAAGLEAVADVFSTEAVMIANPKSAHAAKNGSPGSIALIDKLKARVVGYLTAQRYSMVYYNIAADKLDAAAAITPGRTAPTVMPLADPAFKSLAAMVTKRDSSAVMDALQAIGATDIFLVDIANCRV